MNKKIYIPFQKFKSIGGPSTFMRNLHNYLESVNYPVQSDRRRSYGIFFPVSHNLKELHYFRTMNKAIIQRLDGVYYPSQHGDSYQGRNELIEQIYNHYATHIVFQSDYSRKQCFEMFGTKDQETYSIVHNGVDKSLFYPAQKPQQVPKETIRFITVGNFRKKAMILPIVNSLNEISQKYTIKLTLVGEVTDPSLQQYLLQDYITQVGPKGSLEVARLLRESDVFLHSQLNDNCPNAVLEAIATGIPVVGFNSGAMAELCHFSTDLLADIPYKLFHTYEDFKWEALGDRINFCMQHYEEKQKVALENVALYDFKNCGSKYVEIFDRELLPVSALEKSWNYRIKDFVTDIFQ